MFRRIVVPSYSGSDITVFLGLADPEDEATTILRNIRNYSPSDTASYPRRLESSEMLLSKP
jgi:hypothetical protein